MVSRSDEIIGIDIVIIITFPPISILFAIAFSPESWHILTANSVSMAIPVIFNIILKNWLLIFALFDISFKRFITPDIWDKESTSINTPC